MKKPSLVLLPALMLGASALAQQANIPSHLLGLQRSDWGCEVLLCLSDPNGPTNEPACRPPIERLWAHLKKGGKFPECKMATGSNGRSYAQPLFSYYDPCPGGTSELGVAEFAQLSGTAAGTPPSAGNASNYTYGSINVLYWGIGDGTGFGPNMRDNEAPADKVCVSGYRGNTIVQNGEDIYNVRVYDNIYLVPAASTPNAIDVFIDDSFYRRVRW